MTMECTRPQLLLLLVVAITVPMAGCSNIEMTADTSPGPATVEDYDVTVTEPTTGDVFGNMYCIGQVSHGWTIAYVIPNLTEKSRLHEIEIVRYGESDLGSSAYPIVRNISGGREKYHATVDAPTEKDPDTYRYGLKAYNESGHVIDAINITVSKK